MFFVQLHKPYRGQVDTVLIRADLIIEVSTRRQTKKAAEYDPTPEEGATIGGWVLIDRIGWAPCLETPEEVQLAMVTAEVEYRRRLEAGKTP
jgi:hypothetical protein